MYNGKYTTLNRVIENIARDTGYNDELYINDVREWAVRAMNLIGVDLVYDQKVITADVVDYKYKLPEDVVEIKGIRDSVSKRELVSSTDEFVIGLNDEEKNLAAVMGPNPREVAVASYKVVPGYIFFNFKEGTVQIAYTKYPVDENGCLKIPDVDRYLMAIEAYIIYKIDSKLYRRGLIPRDVKFESEQNWLWYVNSAANKIITPNYDVAENLGRMANRMRSPRGAHSRGFGTLNYPTVRKI